MSPKLGFQRKLGTDVNQLVVIKINVLSKESFQNFTLYRQKAKRPIE